MTLINYKKILIVGLGLIGGSYAKRLKEKGFYIGAIDKSNDTINYALKNDFIDSGFDHVKKDYVKDFDIVIFALYPQVLLKWIENYHDYFKDGALLTDVTGVKGSIIYEIQKLLPSSVEFIGSHPMAGKEVSGIKNADATIFSGANYLVTPTSKNTEEAITCAKEIGIILGFKNISVLSPEEHDEMIAFLSQLTHCIAISLMCSKESEHLVEYTGDSFRDLTRIANINETMWTELFLMNKRELLAQMKLFENTFKQLQKAIKTNDEATLKQMMKTSTLRRQSFDRK